MPLKCQNGSGLSPAVSLIRIQKEACGALGETDFYQSSFVGLFNGTGHRREKMQSDVLKDISLYGRAGEQMNHCAPRNFLWRSCLTLSVLILSFICLLHTAGSCFAAFVFCVWKNHILLLSCFAYSAVSVCFLPPYAVSSPGAGSFTSNIWQGQPGRQAALRETLPASPLSVCIEGSNKLLTEGLLSE